MISKLFNIFLKTNPTVVVYSYAPNHDSDYKIAPIYSVKSFNESISDAIVMDIINYRDKIVHASLKNITGCTPKEYTDDYIFKEIVHPTHTPKEYDTLNREVSIELEKKWIKYAQYNHKISEKDLFVDVLYASNLEDFAKIIDIEIVKDEKYDAYGTGLYKVDEDKFVIFSTDDNGSDTNKDILTTLCCYNPETYQFELADIMYKNGEFYLTEIQRAIMPEELRHLHIRNLSGKRCFHWKIEEKTVKFRSTEEFRKVVSEKLNKDVDTEAIKSFVTFKLE